MRHIRCHIRGSRWRLLLRGRLLGRRRRCFCHRVGHGRLLHEQRQRRRRRCEGAKLQHWPGLRTLLILRRLLLLLRRRWLLGGSRRRQNLLMLQGLYEAGTLCEAGCMLSCQTSDRSAEGKGLTYGMHMHLSECLMVLHDPVPRLLLPGHLQQQRGADRPTYQHSQS
jgi:hypothetical protein